MSYPDLYKYYVTTDPDPRVEYSQFGGYSRVWWVLMSFPNQVKRQTYIQVTHEYLQVLAGTQRYSRVLLLNKFYFIFLGLLSSTGIFVSLQALTLLIECGLEFFKGY